MDFFNVPPFFYTVALVSIFIMILGFGIPMLFPSVSYGNNTRKISLGTVKFFRTHNPILPWVKWLTTKLNPKEKKRSYQDKPLETQVRTDKPAVRLKKDSEYDIVSIRTLGDIVYIIYDKSCTVNGRDYRLGDYHGEEWVHFKVHPYTNKDGSFSIILRDPFLPSVEKMDTYQKRVA